MFLHYTQLYKKKFQAFIKWTLKNFYINFVTKYELFNKIWHY